jgi:hypothetical protein
MTEKIIPTVGRIVHYYPGVADGLSQFGKGTLDVQPLAAIVAGVHADNMVNLCVFDSYGNPHARPNVYLAQPGTPVVSHAFCSWMPYQVEAAGIKLPVVEASAPLSDTPETGDNNGVEVPTAETIAPSAEVQTNATDVGSETAQEAQ